MYFCAMLPSRWVIWPERRNQVPIVCESSASGTWRASGVKSRMSTTTMVVRLWVCRAVVGRLRVVSSRVSKAAPEAIAVCENQFLVAENQAVLVVQKQGQTHAAGVHEGTVAAAQVHQRIVAAILALDEGVQAGNRAAVQEDGAAVAAADRPRLALG